MNASDGGWLASNNKKKIFSLCDQTNKTSSLKGSQHEHLTGVGDVNRLYSVTIL